jgi:hypothetical protein
MVTTMRDTKAGPKPPGLHDVGAGVGTRPASLDAETYLRRAYDISGGVEIGRDVVLLLEPFYFYKIGRDGKIASGRHAVAGVCDFLEFARTPPWRWTAPMLYEYLSHLRSRELDPSTIRIRHPFITNLCDAILADRGAANKIEARYSGCTFQLVTDSRSHPLVRGLGNHEEQNMTHDVEVAERVRQACVQAALDAYESAGISGSCAEGRWEVAVQAIRILDLGEILSRRDEAHR